MAWSCVCRINNNKICDVKVTTHFDKRFFRDKAFVRNQNGETALIDGVILNRVELEDKYEMDIQAILRTQGFTSDFPKMLRGPFSGMYYDGNHCFAYGNQTGDTFVFYYSDSDFVAVATDFNEIVKLCRSEGKKLTFDEIYANHILSFGYAVEGHTVFSEIKKSQPGCAVTFSGSEVKLIRYHKFHSHLHEIGFDEAVEQLDVEFRKAVNRCFDKDIEYSYQSHLADMSGGLDSRMTTWVACDMGYRPITNMSYAKKGSYDETNARLVAEYLNNEYLFEALDDVQFIYDIEELIRMNYGLATYVGITGGKTMLSHLDFNKFGLEHTGQIGDVVIGSFCKSVDDNASFNIRNLQYSDRITPIVHEVNQYDTKELFGLYYRAFQGALMTHPVRRNYTEVVSPFLDVDFIQFCLNLPLEYRCNHKLYFAWVERKYPQALSIPCTRQKPSIKRISKKDIYHALPTWARHVIIAMCKKLHLATLISDSRGMNPMDYWYENNARMREFIEDYYDQHIDEMNVYPKTADDMKSMFRNGRTMDKLLVLTALAAHHIYVGGGEAER